MEKMRANTFVELVNMAAQLGDHHHSVSHVASRLRRCVLPEMRPEAMQANSSRLGIV
jgi:hypothetical protein